jgi:hypothetical protein
MDPDPTNQVVSDPHRTFRIIDPFQDHGPKEHCQVKNVKVFKLGFFEEV